ncbi:MAG TPA: heme exporter protein CcmD [Propylenella sp.]
MTHLAYILAAYLATAAVLIGMVALIVLDLRAQRRKLRRLEEEGLRRRSEVPR